MSNIVLDETQLGRLWNKMLNTFELRGGYSNATILWTNSSTAALKIFPEDGSSAYKDVLLNQSINNFRYIIIEYKQWNSYSATQTQIVENTNYGTSTSSSASWTILNFISSYNSGTYPTYYYSRYIATLENDTTHLRIYTCKGFGQNSFTTQDTTCLYSCLVPMRILGCNELKPTIVSNYVDTIYPVGAIYTSTNSTSPASLFGGTWTRIYGRFLFGAGSNTANTTTTYGSLSAGSINRTTIGEQGGEVKHTLNTNEMPNHDHGGRLFDQGMVADDYRLARNSNAANGSGNSGLSVNPGWQNISIAAEGGSQSHNNMPPYYVVYMWRRTA